MADWEKWDLSNCGPNADQVVARQWRRLNELQRKFANFLYNRGGYPVTVAIDAQHVCHLLSQEEWERYAELRFTDGMGAEATDVVIHERKTKQQSALAAE